MIKGDRHGLSLSIAEDVDISEVISQLHNKLSSARNFFSGASVRLIADEREINPQERAEIQKEVQENGMNLTDDVPEEIEQPVVETEIQPDNTLLIKRTVRSGQKVHYDGNVIIMGDVNPGAEIACSGDILVLGSLRGVAHAGIKGDTQAIVFAFRLEPTQLRIAHFISRAPDGKVPHPLQPEIAEVKDGIIQIKKYNF